jgi:hypothetical protein
MLKRNQVLLNDWLVDIIKDMADKYDLSFSEVIRIFLCIQLGKMISYAYPEYDYNLVYKETEKIVRRKNSGKSMSMEDLHTQISRLYFECRKAAEFWHEQEHKASKERKSKKKS